MQQYDPALLQQMMQQQAMFGMMPTYGAQGQFMQPMQGQMPPAGQQGQMQQGQQQQGQQQQGGQQQGGQQQGGQQRPRRQAGPDGQRQPVVRNNEIGDPSRVIHMRNVTPDVSQLSIQNLVSSFGRIRNIVMLRQKNQALVEMETTQSAQQMVEFFKDPGYAEIDGRRVYLRYSLHNELTASVHTSKTLLVSMFNTQYDVSAAAQITPMIVYQIFGTYGQVEKIVVLPKNESSAQNHNRVQALVQFDAKETAETVKNMLQGQPVTLGETITFTLDIQFSRMEEIKTSSPHNSLVVPKGSTPQTLLQQQQAQAQQQAQQMVPGQPGQAPAQAPQGQAEQQPQQQQNQGQAAPQGEASTWQ